jgi:hypothetical protein
MNNRGAANECIKNDAKLYMNLSYAIFQYAVPFFRRADCRRVRLATGFRKFHSAAEIWHLGGGYRLRANSRGVIHPVDIHFGT